MKKLDEILARMTQEPGSAADSNSSPANPRRARPEEPAAGAQCPLCGGAGFLRRSLPLDDPDFGRSVPCDCVLSETEAQRTARLQRYSSLGPLTRLTFANLNENGRSTNPRDQAQFRALATDARHFAEEPEGWIVIHGPSGAGKTHVAAAIANLRIEMGQAALFVVVPDLLDHLRAAYSPTSDVGYDRLFDQIRNAPVLILDDLGTENATAWAQEKLFQLINHRYNSMFPLVVTTNVGMDRFDERLRMRLTDPGVARVYHVEGNRELPEFILHDALDLERIRNMTFESFDTRLPRGGAAPGLVQRAYGDALRFADSPEDWLVIEGNHGSGKTHLAAAIANRRRARGERPLLLVVPDLLDYLRYAMERDSRANFFDVFELIKNTPLLILDDLGGSSDTSWIRDRLNQLVNYRYMARLPTVFTLTHDSIRNLDASIASKLADPEVSTGVLLSLPEGRDRDSPPAKAAHQRRSSPR